MSTANEDHFDYVEVVPLYLKDFYNISELWIAKFNRTTAILNFRGDLHIDIDKDFDFETNYYFNRLNNNQYIRMLMGIPRSNSCNIWYILCQILNGRSEKLF